jgi:hypothetical protein
MPIDSSAVSLDEELALSTQTVYKGSQRLHSLLKSDRQLCHLIGNERSRSSFSLLFSMSQLPFALILSDRRYEFSLDYIHFYGLLRGQTSKYEVYNT